MQHYQRWIYCWPEVFIPRLINLQLFAHKLIKWLPEECADWFFGNIMTSDHISCIDDEINEHALNLETLPLRETRGASRFSRAQNSHSIPFQTSASQARIQPDRF